MKEENSERQRKGQEVEEKRDEERGKGTFKKTKDTRGEEEI